MPIIELTAEERRTVRLGGKECSAITLSIISLPNNNVPSLFVSMVQEEDPVHSNWVLRLPEENLALSVRFLTEGDIVPPSREWLIAENQKANSLGKTSSSHKRTGRFTCSVEIPDRNTITSVVSGRLTSQIVFEYHRSFSSPRLQVACFGETGGDGAEFWFETAVPYGKFVKFDISVSRASSS